MADLGERSGLDRDEPIDLDRGREEERGESAREERPERSRVRKTELDPAFESISVASEVLFEEFGKLAEKETPSEQVRLATILERFATKLLELLFATQALSEHNIELCRTIEHISSGLEKLKKSQR